MFLRFAVRCAAYAAWTTPGLLKTDETCVKLTCLYQVQVFLREYTQVEHYEGLPTHTRTVQDPIVQFICFGETEPL